MSGFAKTARADIASDLTGYWPFEEGTGTSTVDASGNGNTGYLLGTTTPSWISGYIGDHALSFDGTSSYVGNMPSPEVNRGAETLSLWVKRTGNGSVVSGFPNESVAIFGNLYGLWGIQWAQWDPSEYVFQVNDIDGDTNHGLYVSVGDSTLWHFLTVVEDNSLDYFYVDGQLAGTTTLAGGTYLSAPSRPEFSGLNFGTHLDQYGDLSYFQGDMDDIRIYNRALSPTDVAQLYTYRPGAPSVSVEAASATTTSSATLNGNIDSIGSSTPTVEGFYYGPTSSYGLSVSSNGSYGTGSYSLGVTDLACGTTYHYQAFATNANGSGLSSDETFTTDDCVVTPPTLSVPYVSSIGSTSVTFSSSMTYDGLASSTEEGFNFGETTSYGLSTSTSGTYGVGSFTQTVTDLACGTTYHYQAFATNSAGTGSSTDETFTTVECSLFKPRGDIDSSIVSITNLNGGANVTSALTDNSTSTSATFAWSSSTNPGMLIDFGTTTSVDRVFFSGTTTQNLGSDGYANWQYPANSNTLPLGRIVVWVGNTTSTSTMTRAGEFMVPYDQGDPLDLEGNVQFSPLQGRYVMLELETAVNWYPYWSGWSDATTSASTTLSWKVDDLEAYGFTGSNVYTQQDAVVLPPNAASALTAAASDLSYYLGQLEDKPVPIVISDSTSTVMDEYPGTIYNIEDLAYLAPDWNTMIANQQNGSLPTEINVEKHGREVDFRAWPYRNVTESVWEFLRREGVVWSYPDAHGEYIPDSGVNLSFLPLTFQQVTTYANWDANAMQPWAEWITQTLRPDYLYVWRNGWNLSENYPGFLYGANEVPTQPSTGIPLSSDYTEEFTGYPHNFNSVLPTRILEENPTWCGFVISSGTRVCPPTSGAPEFDMSNPNVISWVADKMAAVEASDPLDTNSTNINYTTNAFYLLPEDAVTYDQSTSSNDLNLPTQTDYIPYVKQYGNASQSGAFYNFVNKIALQVASSSPGVIVGALNYADVFLPPPNIPSLPSDVRVDLTQYGSPNLPMSSPVNAGFEQVENLWHVKASNLGSYDYALLMTDHWQPASEMPRPLVAGIISREQYLNSIGALTGSMQAYTDNFPYNPWNFYAYTRIRGDTSLTESQILNEFFTSYFNEASSSMLSYYEDMEDWQQQNNVDLHLLGYADGITPGSFPRAILSRMQRDLENAEAQSQYWVTKQRVWYIRQGFNYLISTLGLTGADLDDTSSYTQLGQNNNPVNLDLQYPFALSQGPQGNYTGTTTNNGSYEWQFFSGGGSLSVPVNFTQAGTYTFTINANDNLDSTPQPLYMYVGPQTLGYAMITTGDARNYTFTANIPASYGVQDITLSNIGEQSSANVYSITAQLRSSYTASVPAVTEQSPTSIGTSSVRFNGDVTSNGNASIVAEGFNFGDTPYYGLIASPTSTSTDDTFPTGAFSVTATGLNCGSTYHYQAYAQNSLGMATSSDSTFTTESCNTGAPSLTTVSSAAISGTSFILYANISSIGSSSVDQSGFAYGTSPGLFTGVSTTTLGSQSGGNFNQTISGLSPDTTYYFRAYAVNSSGTSTGAILSFTTRTGPTGITSTTLAGGGSVPIWTLASLLAPGRATTAYLNSISATPGCSQGHTCAPAPGSALNPSAPSYAFAPGLSLGNTGQSVKNLQVFLNSHGYTIAPSGPGSPGNETMMYGYATEAALEKFQCAEHIACSGTPSTTGYGAVGPKTAAALNALEGASKSSAQASSTAAYSFTRDLTIGSTGADVTALQKYLNGNGFTVSASGPGSPGDETDDFGTLTESALAKFQAANGISPALGYFGPETRKYVEGHPFNG